MRTWAHSLTVVVVVVTPLFAASIVSCGDEGGTASGGNTRTSGASVSSSSSGSSGEAGGSGGGGGGEAGSGGSGGGSASVPWEGHIDPNGGPSSDRLEAHELGTTTAPQGFYDYVPAG